MQARGPLPNTDDLSYGKRKEALLKSLLIQRPIDFARINELALSPGGYISNEVRQLIWPKLLGINRFEVHPYRHYIQENQWSDQITRDVDRSLWHYYLAHAKKRKRGNRRKLLADMINAIMVKNPKLHYYQGYHDVISILVLVLTENENLTFAVAEMISLTYFGDWMLRPDFSVLMDVIQLIFPLLAHVDKPLAAFLHASGIHSYVCLPWIITWWAHDIHEVERVARLFDALLARGPLFSLYLAVSMIVYARKDILDLECEFSSVHSFLSKLPSRGELPLDELVQQADVYLKKAPPERLVRESKNSQLQEMAKDGAIQALSRKNHRPAITRSSVCLEPDWVLTEEKRRKDGRHVRSRLTRKRRRQAAAALAAGTNRNSMMAGIFPFFPCPKFNPHHPLEHPSLLSSVALIGLSGVTAAVLTIIYYHFHHLLGLGPAMANVY